MTLLSGQSWSHSLSTLHSNTWKVVVTFLTGHALSWCLYSGVGILLTVQQENQFLGHLTTSFNRNYPSSFDTFGQDNLGLDHSYSGVLIHATYYIYCHSWFPTQQTVTSPLSSSIMTTRSFCSVFVTSS